MRRLVYSAALLLVAACGDPDDMDGGNLPGHMGEEPSNSGGHGGLAQRPSDQSGGSTSTGAVTGSGGTGGSDDEEGSGTGGITDPGDTGGSGGTEGSGGSSSGGSGGSDNEDNPGTGGTVDPPEEELMSWPSSECEGFTAYRKRPGECLWVNGDFYIGIPGPDGCYASNFEWHTCANLSNHEHISHIIAKPGRTYGVARFEGGCEIRCKEN